ncbi:unnamed protein product [Linum trigynum]|uniref:Uncharacterized protein n=1 Tax=Linum trigynum TaxID=586398 RepID=A0AAV2G969_9ROSI
MMPEDKAASRFFILETEKIISLSPKTSRKTSPELHLCRPNKPIIFFAGDNAKTPKGSSLLNPIAQRIQGKVAFITDGSSGIDASKLNSAASSPKKSAMKFPLTLSCLATMRDATN